MGRLVECKLDVPKVYQHLLKVSASASMSKKKKKNRQWSLYKVATTLFQQFFKNDKRQSVPNNAPKKFGSEISPIWDTPNVGIKKEKK